MKRLIMLLLLSIAAISSAYSAFSISGDVFSASPGLREGSNSVREAGMGRSGSALFDSINYSHSNPSSFALVDFTVLSSTYSPEIVRSVENGARSFNFGNDFPNVEMIVPLGRYGVVSGSIVREFRSNSNVSFTDSGYKISRIGSGGLWSGRLGYAGHYKKKLFYGVELGSIHGKVTSGRFVKDLPDSNPILYPSRLQKAEYSGFLVSGGLSYRTGSLSLALSAKIPAGALTVNATRQTIQYWSTTYDDSTVVTQTEDFTSDAVPASIRFGLAFAPKTRLSLTFDGEAVLHNGKDESLEYYAGAGAEFRFSDSRDYINYLRNIPIRFGAFYHKIGAFTEASEAGLALGFSLPTPGQYGYVNFAVEGFRRFEQSLTDNNAYHEDAGRISVQYVHKGRWGRLRKAQTGDIQ
ncbi:MAG: hypothetical protein JNL74_18450 [Fibrobacteres bacterium]|nr:hypothetical protein [Fibrobacterota bacterium]